MAAEAEVEVSGRGAAWFSGIRTSIQKVDLGDSSPRRRYRVRAEFRDIKPVSVTDPVSVHLKNLCH